MKINLKKLSLVLLGSCLLLGNLPLSASTGIVQISTEEAPKAIGPYSQATSAGSFMFLSGQIAIDPATGKVTAESIEDQTKQVLKNMEAVLAAHGLTFENVVKTEVYLKDLNDFQSMNAIYAEKFSYSIKPARVTIQAAKLPMDVRVEISATAYIPNPSDMK